MNTLQIETIEEPTRWTVVMDGEREVFRAPKPGHNKLARAKCERWIKGQNKNLDYYRESARITDAAEAFVRSRKGTHGPGSIPRVASWR